MKKQIHAPVSSSYQKPQAKAGALEQPANELRLALTHRCNYRCSFCHHEGQNNSRTVPVSAHKVLNLFQTEISRGCNDITLTGGEPLLERDLVVEVVDGLALLPASSIPALTIVSNGALWEQEVITRLAAYPGRLKVNISLHTASPLLYGQVTGTHGMRSRVIKSIKALVNAGVKVKLNAVVMRGINSSKGAVMSLLALARGLGVSSVKFLELLRQPGDLRTEALFVGCDEIEALLVSLGFERSREQVRGVELARTSQPGFCVEVKKCSCALGCGLCRDALGRNFGPDLKPHNCFWSVQAGNRPAACDGVAKTRRVA